MANYIVWLWFLVGMEEFGGLLPYPCWFNVLCVGASIITQLTPHHQLWYPKKSGVLQTTQLVSVRRPQAHSTSEVLLCGNRAPNMGSFMIACIGPPRTTS